MDIISTVRRLGFTEYEAKAYLALLRESPMTGYGVAKASGVPRSKVYEVLDALVARGDVLAGPGEPCAYRPLPAADLVASRRAAAEEGFARAEEELSSYGRPGPSGEGVWNIQGRDAILERARACVASAGRRVLLEVWAEDFPDLADALEAAAARGVAVTVVAYGEVDAPFADVRGHEGGAGMADEYGGRWVVLSADDAQVLAGAVSLGDASLAAWSSHPGLVMPITEVVVHDLYIDEILSAHRAELEATFGPGLAKLRARFAANPDGRKHYIG